MADGENVVLVMPQAFNWIWPLSLTPAAPEMVVRSRLWNRLRRVDWHLELDMIKDDSAFGPWY
jgi:hypothetical protein